MTVLRYGVICPFAAAVTIGLGLIMRSIVETEFVPQSTDRMSTALATHVYGQIYGQIIICGGHFDENSLPHLRSFLLAPPKPSQKPKGGVRISKNPNDIRKMYIAPRPDSSFSKIELKLKPEIPRNISCHGHVTRLPPKFPPRFVVGNHSGFCKIAFVYDETGHAAEIDIMSCTHESLEKSTRDAVQNWHACGDRPAAHQRQIITVRYDLMDEKGEFLPYP